MWCAPSGHGSKASIEGDAAVYTGDALYMPEPQQKNINIFRQVLRKHLTRKPLYPTISIMVGNAPASVHGVFRG
uniref:hypothetical protein n=1 Tax=Sulfuriferula sp. GW6 TaxID=3345112 RepID=UPI0039F66334